MDGKTRAILAVIAIELCSISAQLWLSRSPTYGDFLAIKEIQNSEERKQAYTNWLKRIPVARVQGGDIQVTGEVSIDGNVDVNEPVSVIDIGRR